jgi:hypothetical protein
MSLKSEHSFLQGLYTVIQYTALVDVRRPAALKLCLRICARTEVYLYANHQCITQRDLMSEVYKHNCHGVVILCASTEFAVAVA